MPRHAPAAPLVRAAITTPHGTFLAHFTDHGLVRLGFPSQSKREVRSDELSEKQERWLKLTRAALAQLFAGEKLRDTPPHDESAGTDFQRAVWHSLRQIQAGQTRTYSQIAAAIGRPRAVRAVGTACGANPIPLLIPCHRVVAANGLGGFSGGLAWKKRVLAAEAAALKTRSARR